MYLEYFKLLHTNDLSQSKLSALYINCVKNGNFELCNKLDPLINFNLDELLLLYKGRFVSSSGNYDQFFDFFDVNQKRLQKSSSLREDLLPLYWRMGINKAAVYDINKSNYYFDMHHEIATISKHEMSHYYQCYGAVLVTQDGMEDKSNKYLSTALKMYFEEFSREEIFYSVIDNIRCIIMNLLLQGILDFKAGDIGTAYKKFMYCKLWLQEANITNNASGVSEIVNLIKKMYPDIIAFIFKRNSFDEINNSEVIQGILEADDIFKNTYYDDIGLIRRDCILLNKPIKRIKYYFMEELIMDMKKVFVVEGRNHKLNEAMFTFLSAIGLEPMEWEQARIGTGKATPYIGEILDYAFKHAQAIVVLITPDEETILKKEYCSDPDDGRLKNQPRANVIFEAGAAFALNPNKTILVSIKGTDLWTDIEGKHIVYIDNTVAKRQILVERLKTSGCNIDVEGKTRWHTQGDFSL